MFRSKAKWFRVVPVSIKGCQWAAGGGVVSFRVRFEVQRGSFPGLQWELSCSSAPPPSFNRHVSRRRLRGGRNAVAGVTYVLALELGFGRGEDGDKGCMEEAGSEQQFFERGERGGAFQEWEDAEGGSWEAGQLQWGSTRYRALCAFL